MMDADIKAMVSNRHINPLIRQWLVAGAIGWDEIRVLVEQEPEFIEVVSDYLSLSRIVDLAEYRYPFFLPEQIVANAFAKTEAWQRAKSAAEWDDALRPLTDMNKAIATRLANGIMAVGRALSRS